MDQTTTQTQPNQVTNFDNVNVTQKVDPNTLPVNQVSNDLQALKSAEDFMTGKKTPSPSLNTPVSQPTAPPIPPKPVIDPNMPQELQALHLKNPFKGE